MSLPNTVLLDTNVWIDNYVGNRKNSSVVRALINICQQQNIELCAAILSLKDVYYQIGAELKREQRATEEGLSATQAMAIEEIAWQCAINLSKHAVLVAADQSDFVTARFFHQIHPDLEDDLILAAVERSEADYLITNDKRLLSHAPVAALTPAEMLTLLKAAEAV